MPMTHRLARHFSVSMLSLTAIGALLNVAGCAPSHSSSKPVAAIQQPTPVAASTDARFIAAAERSSGWAIHMSDFVIANGSRPDVKALATAIKTREAVNLALLSKERTKLQLGTQVTDHHDDAHMHADEERLKISAGKDADEFYVRHMIEQRRGVIELVEVIKPDLKSLSLVFFAQSTSEERAKEVSDLRQVESVVLTVPMNARAGNRSGVAATTTPPRR